MKRNSISFKLSLYFTLILVIITGLSFFALRQASRMVLRTTVRDYLISTVEENVSQIQYAEEIRNQLYNVYLPYQDGYLEIDADFMDVVYDVHAGLYSADGELLYGEDLLPQLMEEQGFGQSRIWSSDEGSVKYYIYDRMLDPGLPDGSMLWIRGIVPGSAIDLQMARITRLSLMMLPFIVIIALALGYFLTGRQLAPLRTMEEAAARITKGEDLSTRIEIRGEDELGHLAGSFNHMLDRLEHSFEAERQFTSDVSHELRTPLSVIMAESEYSLEKELSPEEYREALGVIKGQAGRMNGLISDMLSYTRLDQASERYPMERLDLSLLLRELCQSLSRIEEKDIELRSSIEEGVIIRGNGALIERMVQNLVSNAYRYGKEGGHIWVELKTEEGHAVLSVKDDGIGIAKDDQEKVFERFYRADPSRSEQGTGLGLAMVKRIAELHGAELSLESMEGLGSCFKLVFK